MAQTNINKVLSIKKLNEMLHHFEKYDFIKLINNKAIQFSFISNNLKEYIRREWILANLVLSDLPTFLCDSIKTTENLYSTFENIRSFTGSLPFSVVEIENNHCTEIDQNSEKIKATLLLTNQFKTWNGTVLRSHTFCHPTNAEELFYKVQKNRKIWWRKFAACPGRFLNSTSTTQKGDKTAISEIQAEFPWGSEVVETIKYSTEFCADAKDPLEVQAGKRKKNLPQIVTCETILENMTLTYLCDSYENLNEVNDRNFLRFDWKLAPFKVSIAGSGSSSEVIKDLEELSLLLAKQIRRLGLSVLFLPDACTSAVDKQILRNDALGVPFTLLLNENTLKDGTITIRSRDTTLEEHSHVSLVVEYLEKIFK